MRTHAVTKSKEYPDGKKPFTPEEEAEWDAKEAEWEAGAADREAQIISDEAEAKLRELDLKSIRSIRECIAKKEDAPQFLKDYETQAVNERKKLK